jgi:hypothetical protein
MSAGTAGTINARFAFQSSVTNGLTGVLAVPNGTSTTSAWNSLNNSDINNAGLVAVRITGNEGQLYASRFGTTAIQPSLGLYTSGVQRMTITSSTGVVSILTNTNSTSVGTGALVVAGGVGVGGNLVAPGLLHCEVSRSSDQSAANDTDVIVEFNKINSDPQNWYSTSTYKITPTVAGYYLVQTQVIWGQGTGASTDQQNIQIRKNGTTVGLAQETLYTGSTAMTQNTFAIIQLNGSSDYIEVSAYNGGSAAQFIRGAADGAWTKVTLTKLQ